jgi:hypothetical protein
MPLDFDLTLDRLVICFYEPSDIIRKTVSSQLPSIGKQGPGPFRHITFSNHYQFSGSFTVAGYGHTPVNVFFQAMPRYRGKQPDYRLDFNPATVSPQGEIEILDVLDWLGLDPWDFFSQGIVTRVDYALDLYRLSVEDVIARHPRARKHQVCSGAGGVVETTYCGSPRSRERTVAYTKRFKGAPEDRAVALRLERRIKPNCHGCELKDVPNPFAGIQLVKTRDLLTVIDPAEAIPEHLIDSIRLRGLKALEPLSSKHRNKIMKAFKDPAFSLMSEVEAVWGQCSDALMRSGIGCLLQGKAKPTGVGIVAAGAA